MIFHLAPLLYVRKNITLNTLRRCWLKIRTISNTNSMEEPPWRKILLTIWEQPEQAGIRTPQTHTECLPLRLTYLTDLHNWPASSWVPSQHETSAPWRAPCPSAASPSCGWWICPGALAPAACGHPPSSPAPPGLREAQWMQMLAEKLPTKGQQRGNCPKSSVPWSLAQQCQAVGKWD